MYKKVQCKIYQIYSVTFSLIIHMATIMAKNNETTWLINCFIFFIALFPLTMLTSQVKTWNHSQTYSMYYSFCNINIGLGKGVHYIVLYPPQVFHYLLSSSSTICLMAYQVLVAKYFLIYFLLLFSLRIPILQSYSACFLFWEQWFCGPQPGPC